MFLRLGERRLRAVAHLLPALVLSFGCEQGAARPGSHNDAPVPTLTPSNPEPIGPEPEVFVPLEPSGAANVYVTDEHLYFDYPNDRVIRRIGLEDRLIEDVAPLKGWRLVYPFVLLLDWDASTAMTTLTKLQVETQATRVFELAGYYQGVSDSEEAYYLMGIGCSNPARISRDSGEVIVQEFAPISEGGSPPTVTTERHVYCANALSMMRLPRDFSAEPEYVYRDKAQLEGFTQNETQIVLLQRQQVFGDFGGGYPPHSFQVFDKDMTEGNLVVERWAVIDRSANTGAFIFDPSTRCYYYTHASTNYGSVQYYCEDGRAEALVDVRQVRGGLAIDDEYVYWAERSGVMRLPKPVIPD